MAAVGTGGTISGTGRFLKDASGGTVQVVAADPYHSVYGGGDGAAKYVEGAGHALHPDTAEDIWPEAFDTAVVDRYERVSDGNQSLPRGGLPGRKDSSSAVPPVLHWPPLCGLPMGLMRATRWW